MNMKTLTLNKRTYRLALALLQALTSVPAFSQAVLIKEYVSGNTYSVDCELPEVNSDVISRNGRKIIRFPGFSDLSQPGSFILPEKDLFIELPFNSTPEISITVLDFTTIQAEPEVYTLKTAETGISENYSSTVKKTPNDTSDLFTLKGFIPVSGKYCAHIKVKQYQYDYRSISVNENLKLRINFTFKDSELPEINQNKLKQNSDLIINYNAFSGSISDYIINNDTTDKWIDYSKTYVKLGTARDGIYRIYGRDLSALNINIVGIDPCTIKLYKRGKEIPVYVRSTFSNSVSENDYIEFYGSRNYGEIDHYIVSGYGKPYNEYLGRYSDTTIYWLTWDGVNGKRIDSIYAITAAASDTIVYFQEIIHEEKNLWYDFSTRGGDIRAQEPDILENETWIWWALNCTNNLPSSYTFRFSAPDLYPSQEGRASFKMQSAAASIERNAHLVSLRLNSLPYVLDSININKYDVKVLSGSFQSSSLNEGNNILKVFSYPTSSSVNQIMGDWFEVVYPRYLRVYNDSLNFGYTHFPVAIYFCISVEGIPSSPFILYRIDSNYQVKRITNYHTNGCRIFFNDTINESRRYILLSESRISRPVIYYKKNFINLRMPSQQADYLLITHPLFIQEARHYTYFISSVYRMNAKAVNVYDIYDEFNYGFPAPEPVKNFLKIAYFTWQKPLIKYLFLVGQTTYDHYGNMSRFHNVPVKKSYLPTYGVPVSDIWFGIWDTSGAVIPQINIGRLPAESPAELKHYLDKHKAYFNSDQNEWNKRFLFFSGGNYNDTLQISNFRKVNDYIFNSFVLPDPIGGHGDHFYKTSNPVSSFGPFSPEQFRSSVQKGAIMISYIGHSATQTWDNSIVDPAQLDNNCGRNPFISDFGCSTARFAEPDIVSFSELFVNKPRGQAIAYVGNSSLGFISTSLNFPSIFYRTIVTDSIYNLGEAHRTAKIRLMQTYGSTGAYRIFTLTNHLIGDPVISIPLPVKPDLSISSSDISCSHTVPDETVDYLLIKFPYRNAGRFRKDTFNIEMKHFYDEALLEVENLPGKLPLYMDSVCFNIRIKNLPGRHRIVLTLDSGNSIPESSESNNSAEFCTDVLSALVRSMLPYSVENKTGLCLNFLTPHSIPSSDSLQIELWNNRFSTSKYIIKLGPVFTFFLLDSCFLNERTWITCRLSGSNYGKEQSFIAGSNNGFIIRDSTGFSALKLDNVRQYGNSIYIDTVKIKLSVLSAGFNDGKTALICSGSRNLIPENTIRGHHVCLFRSETMEFVGYRVFDLHSSPSITSQYMNFLDTLGNGYIIAIAIADEGSQNLTIPLRNKIKEFGSRHIDRLGFRDSWAFIGRRGTSSGSVSEAYSKCSAGRISIDTVLSTVPLKGSFSASSDIGPAAKWTGISWKDSTPGSSHINLFIAGIRKDGSQDSIDGLITSGNTARLTNLDAHIYPYIKVLGNMHSGTNGEQPSLSELQINYDPAPELLINYQSALLTADTVNHGEAVSLTFSLFNVSPSRGERIRIRVCVRNSEKKQRLLMDTLEAALDPYQSRIYKIKYHTNSYDGNGRMEFDISADPENSIAELFEDNNKCTIPFFIKPDTSYQSVTAARIRTTFDNVEIFDGDYVSRAPEVGVSFNYPVWFPYYDSSSVQFILDNRRVWNNQLSALIDSVSRNISFNFKPVLSKGLHELTINGRNTSGFFDNTPGYSLTFSVSDELQIMNPYNYPNPFSSGTYFTFNLTDKPDELYIRIYTVAGRMIKEIKKSSIELNTGYNKIFWEGKDEDNDELGNGVYFYKITAEKTGMKCSVIQKLAKIK